MFSLRKIIASLTAFVVIFSILGQTVMAVESEAPSSSLDDLPYATSVDESVRASLLDSDTIHREISFSHATEESIVTLLADKRIFE